MDKVLESTFSNLFHVMQAIFFAVALMITVNVGFRYYERYTTKHDIENFMIDMLDYGSTHNGFNNPTESIGMTFFDVQNRFLQKYKLEGKINGSIQLSPAANSSLHYDRLEMENITDTNLSITVTPLYKSLNPFKQGDDAKIIGKTITMTANIRGYVKTTQEKSREQYYPHITDDKIIDVTKGSTP